MALSSCNQSNQKTVPAETKNLITSQNTKDIKEIHNLIKEVLKWADSKNSIDLLPAITDSKDSIYIGFDLEKHEQNLNKLKATNFFAKEFIENYNQIILTLDKGLRNGGYEQWLVGDLPTFIFANDVNPWCNCQDNFDWDKVEINAISLDDKKGEFNWYWGHLNPNIDSDWKEFKYNFRVTKEDNKWKIAYMEGFEFKESTRKDGELPQK